MSAPSAQALATRYCRLLTNAAAPPDGQPRGCWRCPRPSRPRPSPPWPRPASGPSARTTSRKRWPRSTALRGLGSGVAPDRPPAVEQVPGRGRTLRLGADRWTGPKLVEPLNRIRAGARPTAERADPGQHRWRSQQVRLRARGRSTRWPTPIARSAQPAPARADGDPRTARRIRERAAPDVPAPARLVRCTARAPSAASTRCRWA